MFQLFFGHLLGIEMMTVDYFDMHILTLTVMTTFYSATAINPNSEDVISMHSGTLNLLVEADSLLIR